MGCLEIVRKISIFVDDSMIMLRDECSLELGKYLLKESATRLMLEHPIFSSSYKVIKSGQIFHQAFVLVVLTLKLIKLKRQPNY